MDFACSLALGGLLLVLSAAYAVRVARAGRATHARVEAEGHSALLSKAVMEMMCWCAAPLVSACARLRVSPDAVTCASLALGLAAGVAFATGHLGLGALCVTAAGAGDAVDGLLARRLGVASAAGEVLDAAVDRYVDFALLAGLAFLFRTDALRFLLTLLALQASFMVSYSTAKAEALHAVAPRGSMRRVERTVLLVLAAALTPVLDRLGAPGRDLPLLVALGLIAVLGNASAVRRLAAVRSTVRLREATPSTPSRAQRDDGLQHRDDWTPRAAE